MNTKFWKQPASLLGLGTLAALTLLTTPAPAQRPYGPPPGHPPFGHPPFNRMGWPPFGGPRPITFATAPLSALSAGLNLTGDQQDKIARIKQKFRQKRQAEFGPPPAMKGLEQQADGSIGSVLTGAQKQSLPRLLKTFHALRAAGIPLSVYSDLKLTPAQTTALAGMAPSLSRPSPALRAKVMALFTERQKEQAEEARDESHFPGPGGPPPGRNDGGFGPPPGGFGLPPGGPPPPDGF